MGSARAVASPAYCVTAKGLLLLCATYSQRQEVTVLQKRQLLAKAENVNHRFVLVHLMTAETDWRSILKLMTNETEDGETGDSE